LPPPCEHQRSARPRRRRLPRDTVKSTHCVGAGIGYHEVVAGHITPSELRRLVEKLVPGG
jgi:hypothetical protein